MDKSEGLRAENKKKVAERRLLVRGDARVGVEKLWINLWGSRWESCGKNWRMVWESRNVGKLWEKVGVLRWGVEKFCRGFTHSITEVGWGFAQFPQPLLLLL